MFISSLNLCRYVRARVEDEILAVTLKVERWVTCGFHRGVDSFAHGPHLLDPWYMVLEFGFKMTAIISK